MKNERATYLGYKKKLEIFNPSYFISNIIQPLLLETILTIMWHRGDLAYYLCDLYNDPNRQNELYTVLYNLLTKDKYPIDAIIPYIHPLEYGVLKHRNLKALPLILKNGPFNFAEHCPHPLYSNQNVLRGIASTVYPLIHYARNSTTTLVLNSLSIIMDNLVENKDIKTIVLGPINEELIMRWLHQRIIMQKLPKIFIPAKYHKNVNKILIPISIFAQAIFFAAAHPTGQTSDLSRFLGGLFLGVQYEKTNSLFVPICMHMLWNGVVTFLSKGNDINTSINRGDILDPAHYIDDGYEKILLFVWRPILFMIVCMCFQYAVKIDLLGSITNKVKNTLDSIVPSKHHMGFFNRAIKSTSTGAIKGLAISTIPASLILLTTGMLCSDESSGSDFIPAFAIFNSLASFFCLIGGATIGAISGFVSECVQSYNDLDDEFRSNFQFQ